MLKVGIAEEIAESVALAEIADVDSKSALRVRVRAALQAFGLGTLLMTSAACAQETNTAASQEAPAATASDTAAGDNPFLVPASATENDNPFMVADASTETQRPSLADLADRERRANAETQQRLTDATRRADAARARADAAEVRADATQAVAERAAEIDGEPSQ